MNSDKLDVLLASWLQGFLSGMNAQRTMLTDKDMKNLPDTASLLAYVDKYCRENPLKSGYEASLRLYSELEQ